MKNKALLVLFALLLAAGSQAKAEIGFKIKCWVRSHTDLTVEGEMGRITPTEFIPARSFYTTLNDRRYQVNFHLDYGPVTFPPMSAERVIMRIFRLNTDGSPGILAMPEQLERVYPGFSFAHGTGDGSLEMIVGGCEGVN